MVIQEAAVIQYLDNNKTKDYSKINNKILMEQLVILLYSNNNQGNNKLNSLQYYFLMHKIQDKQTYSAINKINQNKYLTLHLSNSQTQYLAHYPI